MLLIVYLLAGQLCLSDDQNVTGTQLVGQTHLAAKTTPVKLELAANALLTQGHGPVREALLERSFPQWGKKQIGFRSRISNHAVRHDHDQAVQPQGETKPMDRRPSQNFRQTIVPSAAHDGILGAQIAADNLKGCS